MAKEGTGEAKEDRAMGNGKHKAKKRKRHERQIAEGKRLPKPKVEKKIRRTGRIPIRLSSMDPEVVRGVLDMVSKMDIS